MTSRSIWTRTRSAAAGLVFSSGAILSAPAAYAAQDIVFLMDGSGSISSADFDIQKQGIETALNNDTIVPRDGSIGFALVQFAGGFPTRTEVPFTVIESEEDIESIRTQVLGIQQLGGLTNPGDAILAATTLLTGSFRPDATHEFCLSTDGLTNFGVSVDFALAQAMGSTFGLDAFGVIAIEDPPIFFEPDFLSFYGGSVFGDREVVVTQNSAEFASFFGQTCLAPEVELVGLELTQSVQDIDNRLLVVNEKRGFIRAYVQPKDEDPLEVSFRLRGERGGTELPGSPLLPINDFNAVTVETDVLDNRAEFDSSLNFDLPIDWMTGDLALTLESSGAVLDCREGPDPDGVEEDGDCAINLTFQKSPELITKLIAVRNPRSSGLIQGPTQGSLDGIRDETVAMYPVSQSDTTSGLLIFDEFTDFPIFDSRLKSQLITQRVLELGFLEDRLYLGIIGGQPSPLLSGIAFPRSGTAISNFLFASDLDGFGVHTPQHEVGHLVNLFHTALVEGGVGPCGSVGGSPFPNIGDVNGRSVAAIGPITDEQRLKVFGMNSFLRGPFIMDPDVHFALMSSCTPTERWVSDFNYENIHSNLFGPLPGDDLFQWPPGFWVLRGTFGAFDDTLDFYPISFFDGQTAPALPNSGEFLLILEDSSGNTVFQTPFDTLPSDAQGVEEFLTRQFLLFVPVDSSFITARILKNGVELGVLTAAPGAPTVEIVSPNGGETLTGDSVTVTWVGNDPDGDPLSYILQFSADNGVTWQTLAIDYRLDSAEVPLEFLKSTETGLFRVQVSDGINVAEDVSDGNFSVPNNAPRLKIISPNNEQFYVGTQAVIFRARAYDTDEGDLPAENFQWFSSRDGFIGSGVNFRRPATDFSEGLHIIEARIADDSGDVFSVSVAIFIGRVTVPRNLVVQIDVKPGNESNVINPGAEGVIPVAILSSRTANGDPVDFDATQIDPTTLSLQGASARERGNSGNFGSEIDVNGDGLTDLRLNFETSELQLSPNDTMLVLEGQLLDGSPFMGTAPVTIVP